MNSKTYTHRYRIMDRMGLHAIVEISFNSFKPDTLTLNNVSHSTSHYTMAKVLMIHEEKSVRVDDERIGEEVGRFKGPRSGLMHTVILETIIVS